MILKARAFLRELGERIGEWREGQSLTQAELGERYGPHRTFVGSVERCERDVSLLDLRAIALPLRAPQQGQR